MEEEEESMRLREEPLIPFVQVRKRTAKTLGVSEITAYRVTEGKFLSDDAGPSKLSTPGKKRHREGVVTNLDGFQQDAVRRHIYSYYFRKEIPTCRKLLVFAQRGTIISRKPFFTESVARSGI